MPKLLLPLLTLLALGWLSPSSTEREYYADRLQRCYAQYDSTKQADSTFDEYQSSYVGECLNGCYLPDLVFQTLKGDSIRLAEIERPIFMQAFASWCRPCVEEVPALNRIVEEYQDRVAFIGLTWDDAERCQKIADKYHPAFQLVPASQEMDIRGHGAVHIDHPGFQHKLGFPTTYYVTPDKQIVEVAGGGYVTSYRKMEGDSLIEVEIMSRAELDSLTYLKFKTSLDALLDD